MGFGYEPLRLENVIANGTTRYQVSQTIGNPVNYQLITYADVGIELFSRLAVQVELPIAGPQGGNNTTYENATATASAPNTAAVMDLRIDARFIAYRNDARSFKLAFEGGLWLPTGNTVSYGSDGAVAGSLGTAVEYDLKSLFLVGNLMYQGRPSTTIDQFPVGGAQLTVGSEMRLGVGAFVPLRDGQLRVGGEVFGSFPVATTGATGPGANIPLKWMAEGRYWFDEKKQFYAGFGGGTRLTAGYAPDFRFVGLVGYSFGIEDTNPPSPPKRWKAELKDGKVNDRDHDGIPDDVDLCPDEPEDGKPPYPEDGCPAPPDCDGDGIPDAEDACPDVKGVHTHDLKTNGCPLDTDQDGIPDAQDACPLEPGDPIPTLRRTAARSSSAG